MSEFSKTAQYRSWPNLPPLVARSVEIAEGFGFIHCCLPNHGVLLQVLARGRAGGTIGEAGTGCGTGLAWMVSATGPDTKFISVEIDATRAAASKALFAGHSNVTIVQGDWRMIEDYAPFDLLVLDGGGGGKRENDPPADPARYLKPGGSLVLDDFHPPLEFWPEEPDTRDKFGRSPTTARKHWLEHHKLFVTEFRVHPKMSSIVGTLKVARP